MIGYEGLDRMDLGLPGAFSSIGLLGKEPVSPKTVKEFLPWKDENSFICQAGHGFSTYQDSESEGPFFTDFP